MNWYIISRYGSSSLNFLSQLSFFHFEKYLVHFQIDLLDFTEWCFQFSLIYLSQLTCRVSAPSLINLPLKVVGV